MKGVSTIIASIIMVVITIGLISVAYLYISGLLTGITANNIELLDSYCSFSPTQYSLYNITVLAHNIGTANITTGLTFLVDGKTGNIVNTACDDIFGSGDTISCIIYNTTTVNITKGVHQLRVIAAGSVGGPITCQ